MVAASQAAPANTVTASDKRRKITKSQQATGADNLLSSAADKSRTYILKSLEGESRDDLAGLIADMIRDGDLDKALERKKKNSTIRALGPQLPMNKKGQTMWKMLGRRFDREVVEMIMEKTLFEKDEASLKLVSAKRFNEIICMALHQSPDSQVPTAHKYSQFENPLKAACLLRARQVGPRLTSLTKENINDLAYFYWSVDKPLEITSEWLQCVVKLPWPAQEMKEHADWLIIDGWSLKKATFQSESAGRSQKILPLLAKQHPSIHVPDEEAVFEFAQAADGFNVPAASTAMFGGGSSSSSTAAATPEEVISAPGVVATPVPPPPPE